MQVRLVKALKHQDRLIKCSLIDHFVSKLPVSVAFFYPTTFDPNLMIHSLQHVLHDFPIFAGTLVKDNGQLYINCNNQGVSLKIAYSPLSLSKQLKNFDQLSSARFVNEIDPNKILKQRRPVLTINMTYYSDGLIIGYCWHHSIGDMATFAAFLKALSSTAQGKTYQKPVITDDRETYLQGWQNKQLTTSKQEKSLGFKHLTLRDKLSCLITMYSPQKNLFIYFTQKEITSLKASLSAKTNKPLSRNDALCAYLLELTSHSRCDKALVHHTSITINFRKILGMPLNTLGNYVDSISLKFTKPHIIDHLANTIHSSVKAYHCSSSDAILDFIENNGGLPKINRIIPQELLPKYNNLIITNWSNFDVYSIDFGISTPFLFLPINKAPFPWVLRIVEGFNNEGLIASLTLPSKVASRFTSSTMLKKIHQFRSQLSSKDVMTLNKYPWCI